VLGRAQRLHWRDMPVDESPPQGSGVELLGLIHDFHKWQLRERAPGEPLIWHDTWWRDGSREYRGHNEVLIEDVLWQELDANFPDQLNAMQIGKN
jgi:hypothetical protein